MNVFRKASVLVLVAFVAVLAIGMFQSSAEAGGCHSYGYHHVKYPTVSYSPYNNCYSGTCYWPTYHVAKPISYPVTYYDCYGRPYIVWQTSHSNPLW
jgi:hypothetical protein